MQLKRTFSLKRFKQFFLFVALASLSACSLDASIEKSLSQIPTNENLTPGGGIGNGNGPILVSPSNPEPDFTAGGETVQIPSGSGYEIKAVIGGAGVTVINNSYTIEGTFY